MLSAIACGPNRVLARYVTDLAAELGDVCIYKMVYAYPSPHELVQLLNVFTPEVVFLDIHSSPAAFDLAAEIRACYGKAATIGFTQRCDEETRKLAAEAGVIEVLVLPCSKEDFEQAVVRAIQAHASVFADNIIAFLPSKGGSGATTAALHAAISLARDWNKSVLLLEGDSHCGALAALLDLEPAHSVLDALEGSQWLGDAMWERLVTKTHGIDLLPMPATAAAVTFSRWEYQRLLTFVRSHYDFVIADLPELMDSATEAVISEAKLLYMVATPEKGSLFLARRRVGELVSRGAREDRIRMVLNRCPAKSAKCEEAEEMLGYPVSVVLPPEDSLLRRAPSEGPVVSWDSELGKAFRAFARVLAGVGPAVVPAPVAEPKGGFFARLRGRESS